MLSIQKVLRGIIYSTILLTSNTAWGYTYTIDGNYQDWINAPFTDWTPKSDTAFFTDGNNKKGPNVPHKPAEVWDKEWLAFDYDENHIGPVAK